MTHPQPPWPIGSDTNCKRAGWSDYFAGRLRESAPFPPARPELNVGWREGWDAAYKHAKGGTPKAPLVALTVGELITLLSTMPPDKPVHAYSGIEDYLPLVREGVQENVDNIHICGG